MKIDLATMIKAAALALAVGSGVLTIKLDILQLKNDVAELQTRVLQLGCDIRPALECNFNTAENGN